MRGLTLILAGSLAAAPAWGQSSPAQIPFVTTAAGQRSAITVPEQVVVRDAAAWVRLWRRHTGTASARPPAIDFTAEMVIAIFAGHASASTAVAVARILSEPERLVVHYSVGERRPLPMPDEGLRAAPFHIVQLPRSDRAVSFLFLRTPPVLRPGPGS